jgi:phosphoenolpyruvate carboxylase
MSTVTERDSARQQLPAPMRRDVRLLGDLLGEVLRESGGQDLLDDVERLRHAVIAARDSGPAEDPAAGTADPAADTAGSEIADMIAGWPLDRAELVARAFTVYFHLVNLAEEHQRVRTLAERQASGVTVRESLAATVEQIGREQGGQRLRELIAGLEVHPVFTAHPTEARRRAVVTALQRISGLLSGGDGSIHDGNAYQRPELRRRLREEIDLLWRTSQLRVKAMEPLDEVRTVMAAFDETIFRVVPAIYRAFDDALSGPDCGAVPPAAPAFLRFGSWVGGDRDGNPFVTAQVTREAAAIQADHVLRALENATGRIGRALTAHVSTTPPSAGLSRALAVAESANPDLLAGIAARSPEEPHRQYLLYSAERLRATRLRHADLGYEDAAEFLGDLRLVQESLEAAGAPRQAFGELQHLMWQAETFGFHLAELEIRQHSAVHARALAELRRGRPEGREGRGGPDRPDGRDETTGPGRAAGPGDAGPPLSAETEEVLATLRAAGWIQDRFGAAACRRYVVSFTRSAADISAVYELARCAVPDGRVPVLDVVPLFESGEDLRNAPAVLDAMLRLPEVAQRLADSGRRLEVMLGYSDSAKELGPAGATLALFDAQAALARWAADNEVRLTLFHGRGGALGRGGGPAGRAVLAQAPGSVAGRFKVTEQGEVIFARYGQRAIAERHLEQVASAVLLASEPQAQARTAAAAGGFRDVADRMRQAAVGAYRSLVEADGFAGWFGRISPLEEIGGLRIGSRPARRGSGGKGRGPGSATPAGGASLEDLRAIPWVFAWAQTRVNLPGWYGLGTGLAAVAAEPGGLDLLRAAYREWPLLAVLLENAEMSLAKTDRRIAARYLALGGRDQLTAQVLDEYDRTMELVLAVTGHDRPLAGRPVLSRAVALRNPYVDALSHLQLRALAALRSADSAEAAGAAEMTDDEHDRLERLLLLTVNGVAAGLQNTG